MSECRQSYGIRPQYHLRQSPQGLLAWDVRRLIRLTSKLPVVDWPLDQIKELDEPYWYQDETNPPTCQSIADHMRLVQASDLRYPIILCTEGRLTDGMHRVVKAYLQGRTSVLAYQLPVLPEPDYVGVDQDDLPYNEDVDV